MTRLERHYGLDALRGGMMLLGVVLHAAFFHLLDANAAAAAPSSAVLLLIGVIHQFRMPLFFLLAGFFMALLVQRRGRHAAIVNRSRRILLPLVLCLPSILPLTLWLCFSLFLSAQRQELTFAGPGTDFGTLFAFMRERGVTEPFNLFHLWFLYYLFIFCTGAVVINGMMERFNLRIPASDLPHFPLLLTLLVLLTARILRRFPDAVVVVNDPLFVPAPATLLYHGFFFACGYLFWHAPAVLQTFVRYRRLYGAIAFISTCAFAALYFMVDPLWRQTQTTMTALLASLSTWSFIWCLCGLCLHHWNEDTALTRLLTQSAYWVYLTHMPLILFIGLMLKPLQLPIAIALPLNMALTMLICLWTYRRWVRASRLGQLLNGRRYDREGNAMDFRPACAS